MAPKSSVIFEATGARGRRLLGDVPRYDDALSVCFGARADGQQRQTTGRWNVLCNGERRGSGRNGAWGAVRSDRTASATAEGREERGSLGGVPRLAACAGRRRGLWSPRMLVDIACSRGPGRWLAIRSAGSRAGKMPVEARRGDTTRTTANARAHSPSLARGQARRPAMESLAGWFWPMQARCRPALPPREA